jgi:hypothetical protein
MDSAAQQMLKTVKRRMANLQQIERLILEEFIDSSSNGTAVAAKGKRKRSRVATPANAPTTASANGGSRKYIIHEWLKKNGPAKRAEIIKGTGLPEGTVGAYLSTEKDLFESRDGKWLAL